MSATARRSLDEELQLLLTGDLETIQDPYPIWDRLREESPVHRYDPQTAIVSRHGDVKATYKDDRHFPATPALGARFEGQLRLLSDAELEIMAEFRQFEQHTISRKNGPDHNRVRAAARRYFTPRRIAELEPIFQRIFDELIDAHAAEDGSDFMPAAYKLPLLAITEMLGVPRQEAEQVKYWGDFFLATNQNPVPPAVVHQKQEALHAYREYTRQLIGRHRADPDKSELIAAVLDAADGDKLTEDELIAFFLHTLMAGHETTQHMIGNGIRALLVHREQWTAICESPALVPRAVEEILRWDPPVPYIAKLAGPDAEVAGVPIPEGVNVLLLQAAGNRDPDVFTDPAAFDVTRNPNDHISLGWGVHFCLGASLARLEGRIVLETLARRFPMLDCAVDPSTLRYHRGIRGLDALPLKLGPQANS
jgi:pimeloyl-[acyl-carrier protein] synthase